MRKIAHTIVAFAIASCMPIISSADQLLPSSTDATQTGAQEAMRYIQPASPEADDALKQDNYWVKAGKEAMHACSYAEAETDYRNALAATFCDGEAYQGLAEALTAQGRNDEAIQVYEQLIYPKPVGKWSSSSATEARTLLDYSLLLCGKGRWQEALVAYNHAIPNIPLMSAFKPVSPVVRFDATNTSPQMLLAALHLAKGVYESVTPDEYGWHHDKALAEYTQALQIEPTWDAANFYYANGLVRLGRRADAEVAFKKAADLSTGDVKTQAQLQLRRW